MSCQHRFGTAYTAWDDTTGLAWVKACVQCPHVEPVEHIIRPEPKGPLTDPEPNYDDDYL